MLSGPLSKHNISAGHIYQPPYLLGECASRALSPTAALQWTQARRDHSAMGPLCLYSPVNLKGALNGERCNDSMGLGKGVGQYTFKA